MRRWIGVAVFALSVGACTTALRPPGPALSSSEPVPSRSVEQLAAAVAADARQSDHEDDSKIRERLAADAARDAQSCLELAPQGVACLYSRGISLGLDARAHPLRANDALKAMLDALARAEAADSSYDDAGPARVTALVLIKAPGWPLGPGDADAGLAAARRAVASKPLYPPNSLALAEAQAATGDSDGARRTYGHARDLSQALPPSAERGEWLRDAERGLERK